MTIFAYGSNMHFGRLQGRVPSANKISNAFIRGYTLRFNKVSIDGSSKANIIQSDNPDDIVWGVIFEIADNEKPYLDRAEGLGHGYNETTLSFTDINNNNLQALIYVANHNSVDNTLQPYDWYRQFILSGAEANQLPQNYIEKIRAMEFTIDQNEERRQRHLNVINRRR